MVNSRVVPITTVKTTASSYDLANIAAVKSDLNKTDSTDDATLQRCLSAASTAAAMYCNRVFVNETLEDDFWPERDACP